MDYLPFFRTVHPFDRLDPAKLEEVVRSVADRRYPKMTRIVKQGSPSQAHLIILYSGLAEVTIADDHGNERSVGVRHPKEFCGETVVLTGEKYPASVRAVEDTVALLVPLKTLESCLAVPGFAAYFGRLLTERLRVLYAELAAEQSYMATGLETHPFKKKVVEIMSSPVKTCEADVDIRTVAERMHLERISSLVVVQGDHPIGIITGNDLVSKILAKGLSPMGIAVREIMSHPLTSISSEAFYYQALLAMIQNRIKHLPVVDNDQLVGLVTLSDLARRRGNGALSIVNRIEHETTIEGLKRAREKADSVMSALVAEQADPPEILAVATEFNDRLHRKIIELAELQMAAEGKGKPPVEYCFINLGSAGRKEQFARTDQDNGIIYQDPGQGLNPKEVQAYFVDLGGKISEGLFQCGFAKCLGNVMASNPDWCRSLSSWKRNILDWSYYPVPDNILSTAIFLDFRSIFGNAKFAEELRSVAFMAIQDNQDFLQHLAAEDLRHGVPLLGLFNMIFTPLTGKHRGEIDLKKSACVHVVDCARIFALRAGISETSTTGRLRILADRGEIVPAEADSVIFAYHILMNFRIREGVRRTARGDFKNHDYLKLKDLNDRERVWLKEALAAVARFQDHTGVAFAVEGFM